MARFDVLAIRIDETERRLLAELAQRLERSQSDTVRVLIRAAAREARSQDTAPDAEREQREGVTQ